MKRTNRVAWGLASVLAGVVLAGSMPLSVHDGYLISLPRDKWRFACTETWAKESGAPLPSGRFVGLRLELGVIALKWGTARR